ncbi:uncharacterized protein LOC120276520 [Dioscorea cayenensis subsp. rotundata]|uniref:Uncharacterized protein LOC120276520 n=1 Tax=Dioscorea cayennensis subsp. rotundata TaxID=55577 RepID=A0AB40CJF7_DIOCR|nr:uncharacterized protein LOC120276520 [Dioscorea cayenensis subsp. rotundata]
MSTSLLSSPSSADYAPSTPSYIYPICLARFQPTVLHLHRMKGGMTLIQDILRVSVTHLQTLIPSVRRGNDWLFASINSAFGKSQHEVSVAWKNVVCLNSLVKKSILCQALLFCIIYKNSCQINAICNC